MTAAAAATRARSILLGESSDDLQFEVRAQRLTPIASVEVHDIHHVTPRRINACPERAFIDLALGSRPGRSIGYFPDVRGHRRRPMGNMIFIPADLRLRSLWAGGRQRSVCVLFAEENGRIQRQWTPSALDRILDLRDSHLRQTMMRLAAELVEPGFESPLMVEALCLQLSVLLRRHVGQSADAEPRGSLTPAKLRAVEDMLERAGPPPSLAELAAHCGMSSRHFGRLFRSATGRSVTEYAIARRLDRAMKLLGGTTLPIKQIAWQCGFQTAAGFAVAFHRAVGMQPSVYRKGARM